MHKNVGRGTTAVQLPYYCRTTAVQLPLVFTQLPLVELKELQIIERLLIESTAVV